MKLPQTKILSNSLRSLKSQWIAKVSFGSRKKKKMISVLRRRLWLRYLRIKTVIVSTISFIP